MNSAEKLNRVVILRGRISAKTRRLQHLRDMAENTCGANPRLLRGATSRVYAASTDSLVSNIDELEKTLVNDIEKLVDLQLELSNLLFNLQKPQYRQVLRFHYLDGMTAKEICSRMGHSERHIRRLLKEALDALADMG